MIAVISAASFGISIMLFVLAGAGWYNHRMGEIDERTHRRRGFMGSTLGRWVTAVTLLRGRFLSGYAETTDARLRNAGRPMDGIRGDEFVSLLLLCTTPWPPIFAFLAPVAGVGSIGLGLIAGFSISLIFGVLLVVWLDGNVVQRRGELSRDFPFFMEMMVMAMQAGAIPKDGVRAFIDAYPRSALSDELRRHILETEVGESFSNALKRFGGEVGVPRIESVIRTVLHSESMGVRLEDAMRQEAAELRFIRSQRVEREAERLKVRVQGPLVLIMMALLIWIMAPAVVEVTESPLFTG